MTFIIVKGWIQGIKIVINELKIGGIVDGNSGIFLLFFHLSTDKMKIVESSKQQRFS